MRRQSSRLLRDTQSAARLRASPRYEQNTNRIRTEYELKWQRGWMEMEQGDLINLLENLLGPAAAGVAAPHQTSAYQDDEAPEYYFDADNDQSMSGALHPSMTGLLSAAMPIGIVIVETA